MTENAVSLILTRDDYELLKKYISSRLDTISGEHAVAAQLHAEIQNAQVVENADETPADLIRLYSNVKVEEERTGRKMQFQLVLPGEADIKKEKLSVFAPLGIALMGYRKGQKIKWRMPAGEKTFKVIDVS
ncbi:MAG: GreA/GreB family elongation factor [Chitinophagaceae bacterium]|nr:GreA/GreB family elongation factor [Chitinophagaceae bacterium]